MLRFILWQNVLLAVALVVCQAQAEPTEADRATARELATAGYHALKRRDYAIAADRFQRADALIHAPTLVVDWARALTGLGLLVEAQEKYELVIREGIPANSPRPWRRAQDDARAELEALKPRLAWLTLVVSGPDRPSVTVDRTDLPEAALGVPRATNPGTRKIRVEASGYVPETRSIALAEGAQQRLEITLLPKPPEALAPSPVTAPRQRPVPVPVDAPEGQRGVAYAAFVVGGAGLVVGGVTGGLALQKRSKLDSACTNSSCPANERENIDAYHRLGTASGIGFGVALLGVGTGVTLLLTDDSSKSRKETASKRGTTVRPYVGLGTVGAMGSY